MKLHRHNTNMMHHRVFLLFAYHLVPCLLVLGLSASAAADPLPLQREVDAAGAEPHVSNHGSILDLVFQEHRKLRDAYSTYSFDYVQDIWTDHGEGLEDIKIRSVINFERANNGFLITIDSDGRIFETEEVLDGSKDASRFEFERAHVVMRGILTENFEAIWKDLLVPNIKYYKIGATSSSEGIEPMLRSSYLRPDLIATSTSFGKSLEELYRSEVERTADRPYINRPIWTAEDFTAKGTHLLILRRSYPDIGTDLEVDVSPEHNFAITESRFWAGGSSATDMLVRKREYQLVNDIWFPAHVESSICDLEGNVLKHKAVSTFFRVWPRVNHELSLDSLDCPEGAVFKIYEEIGSFEFTEATWRNGALE